MVKRIKDPLYGYIEVPDFVQKVIDTSVFQRLRDIVQTSYMPLYPSATHNRFAHSIGVYHLGTLALCGLKANLNSRKIKKFEPYFKVFQLACLLHDVGHAPFSHTGEQYYLKNSERKDLHEELVKLVKDEQLGKEISENGYKAAPHELVSAIVGINEFENYLENNTAFFARCILGYKYTIDLDSEKKIQNSLIELLNSKVIDVDKLDYLIRDSYYTGFDTVKIDYHRLLSSLCFVGNDSEYSRGFNKSAISVLENVVYAHDAERKWIQNHPSVIYELYLMEQILDRIIKECFKNEYFDICLLSEEGKDISGYGKIRLLSDSSIIYLLKNIKTDNFIDEFLNRNKRKKPLWKSESEFNAIFQDDEISIVMDEFEKLEKYIKKLGFPFVINSKVKEKCESEISKLKGDLNDSTDSKKYSLVAEWKKYLEMIMMILDLLDENEKESGIVIRFTDQFVSNFSKKEFSEIKIAFPNLTEPCDFGKVTSTLKPQFTIHQKKFFYIFSPHGNTDINIKKLNKELLQFAQKIKNEKSSKRFK